MCQLSNYVNLLHMLQHYPCVKSINKKDHTGIKNRTVYIAMSVANSNQPQIPLILNQSVINSSFLKWKLMCISYHIYHSWGKNTYPILQNNPVTPNLPLFELRCSRANEQMFCTKNYHMIPVKKKPNRELRVTLKAIDIANNSYYTNSHS